MTSSIKEKLISIGIAIILTMFIFYGVNTFYPEPDRDMGCKNINSKEACEADGGEWESYGLRVTLAGEDGYCKCIIYENAKEAHSRVTFIIALVLGLIAVILGAAVIKLASVSSGVMAGGILTVIFGSMNYWGNMPDFVRFICLGVVLIILVVLGYRKLKKMEDE